MLACLGITESLHCHQLLLRGHCQSLCHSEEGRERMLLRQASVIMMISGPSESLTWTVLNPAAMSFCMSAIATPFDCVMGQVGMSILESGTSTHSTDSDFREQGFTCCAPAAWSRWWCEEAPPPLVLPPPPRVVASEPACCI